MQRCVKGAQEPCKGANISLGMGRHFSCIQGALGLEHEEEDMTLKYEKIRLTKERFWQHTGTTVWFQGLPCSKRLSYWSAVTEPHVSLCNGLP